MDTRWATLCSSANASNSILAHLARLAAARGAGEAGSLGVDCLTGVGALVGHLRVGALQHAERPVGPLRGRARLGCNSVAI